MDIPPKTSMAIIGSAVILIFSGLVLYRQAQDENPAADKPETNYQRWERQQRQHRQGKLAFAKAVTNDVVGYTRTIESFKILSSDDVGKWWAHATVEYVNQSGGIQRTNLYWKFKADSQMISTMLQTSEQWPEEE